MTILEISAGDTAWVLVSAALVLIMTPGLAFFYGGMVRSKSVLNMMMLSIGTMGVVGVAWVLYGFSFAFGDSIGGFLGNPGDFFGLSNIAGLEVGTIPGYVFVGFQSAFAIIAVALVSGAAADRMKFGAWCLFALLWASLVYFPAAHWVFAFDDSVSAHGGFIANTIGAIDFAGGTAIHINAGAGALALALVLGKRIGFGKVPMRPHNLTLVMLGAALLWFGWFGFNAGSALAANETAGLAWVNTMVCPAAAMLAWLLTERIRDGHATSLGAASGIVAGLVGITPAAAAVTPVGAIIIGILVGVGCSMAISLKYKFGYDDSLDVVGVHLVGGLIGTLAIGFLGSPDLTGGIDTAGLFYGGGVAQLGRQAAGAAIVLVYSFVVSFIIAKVIDKIMGMRVAPSQETSGIDLVEHAEVGYDLSKVQYSTYNKTLLIADPTKTSDDDSAKVTV
ncbi:ammonium transporter [Propionimicrobium sp. PCR01-08-3]|uniref:ammonium transporter n=1 Tax=Propionimicrobium sp. PCR01-08-3 TaxID=3052086 RepID=UPI00255C5997|nr:ammonium transporter [Propionimicrobium sp. PCR01-08-3]WIY82071.1 ammonium transporter [Propionimicrobium sp. PCR01-08-3]